MPHGLTIDHNDDYWITDVAMHQVRVYLENLISPRQISFLILNEFEQID